MKNSERKAERNAGQNEFSNQAEEVLHYTTAEGLLGVVRSKQLWATRSDFLNDREERKGFYSTGLPNICAAVVDSNLSQSTPSDRKKASDELVENLKSFVSEDHAYFTSLSRFPDYDQDHGVLSQWRGYGKDGGYAIVFDRLELDRALFQEFLSGDYLLLKMDDVAYYGSETDDLVGPSVSRLMDYAVAIKGSLNLEPSYQKGSVFEAFTMSAALYKHRGFREEAEVRIVAVPASENIRAIGRLAGRSSPASRKEIQFRSREGLIIPFLSLNLVSSSYPNLPIRRIIVGPHPDADRRKIAVEALLEERGIDAPVLTSGIPYVG